MSDTQARVFRNNYPPVRGIPVAECDSYLWNVASNAFYEGWNGRRDKAPQVVRVLQIGKPDQGSRLDRDSFYRFRHRLQSSRHQSRFWNFKGNEKRLFHGTIRTCRLGNPTPSGGTYVNCCWDPQCSLCNIIQESYDMSHAMERRKRFGKGIYFTENSSRAVQDEFQGRNPRSSRGKNADQINWKGHYRAVLLNRVLIGQPWHADNAAMGEFEKAPPGFDSIVAQYNPGSGRNAKGDNETVVYRLDAVMPWLLIIVDPFIIETEHPAICQEQSEESDYSD